MQMQTMRARMAEARGGPPCAVPELQAATLGRASEGEILNRYGMDSYEYARVKFYMLGRAAYEYWTWDRCQADPAGARQEATLCWREAINHETPIGAVLDRGEEESDMERDRR